ncbi:sigma-54 dependent transcriptional regulator [Geomesophilobacter sediminis]|uniref:Sigma 54-interacting transcriptional regulator n=1 Tax=Geomesophilobacter sediminis TaxID=2798584 RepID=A0A8J7J0B9_9BACT|nr:sigma 54-interacting transcriptional regulator [Geomesophilobacter sediminis]MBJ6723778.1 sigma 54-interacting transcriptional regulator [Geomesophilobacter sediminis]
MPSRILIIDDEESVRFTFRNLLEDEGYHADTADDFDSALELIREQSYDLIISDIFLGGKTGVDILREIRTTDTGPHFVFMTGQPHMETALEAVRLGAFDYLPKPFKSDTLLRVARMALQHKQAIEEKERYRSHLEGIFRSVNDAIITLDPELRIMELNDAAHNLCGLGDASRGALLTEAPNGCGRVCIPLVQEVLNSREPAVHFRIGCSRTGCSAKVVTVTITPLLGRQREFQGTVLVVRDDTRMAEIEKERVEVTSFHRLVGKTQPMQHLYRMVEGLSDLPTTVLISGESGTGKELVAHALHHEGVRRDRPFVRVNCAALSENLLESELFGHVKGAFTGAVTDRTGRFQAANGGTIFLDEIGDITPTLQVRLLRVLQEKEFERVGDTRTVKVDVRVIAATNQDLREKVRQGAFREDLYYRLKVVYLTLPTLRQRKEDLPLLVEHFVAKFNRELKRSVVGVTKEVMDLLTAHPWPGNVRELEHVIEHAFVVAAGETIGLKDLPAELAVRSGGSGARSRHGRDDVVWALEKAGWNKSKAARLLGVDRRTIYRKMEEYEILESF